MLSGKIETWQFKRRFEPFEGGFLYRPSLGSPAYFLSAEERDESLARFKRQRRWRSAKAVLVVMAILVPLEVLALVLFPQSSPDKATWPALLLAPVMMVWLVRQQRRDYRIPLAVIGNREPVRPAQGWLAAIAERLVARSWKVHAFAGIYTLLLCWLLFPRGQVARGLPWYPAVYAVIAAVLVTRWCWITWRKATRDDPAS